ncbi:MAG: helix-turn-helix domain-containing protein [Clostridia bacterium]|nr:helix-turn-helix domain-containing protein [Clostridia bacterium]
MSSVSELRARLALVLSGEADTSPWPRQVYAWRLMRWEADMPLTDEERASLLASVDKATSVAGECAACFTGDGDTMLILLAHTRFPARAHRETVMWLCAHALMENASVSLEQEGTMFIGHEMDQPENWQDQLDSLMEISDWWNQVSPMDGSAAHAHRGQLQTIIKRRQYTALGGYITRALRSEPEPGRICFGFVPLVIEAVWSQHAEMGLHRMTEELNLQEMTRRPREALLAWLQSLPARLRACPAAGNAAPIERVILSIRADCSLPYSQQNLSRSLGLTPAYFCRLFHEKTGLHFSTFLTSTRMEKAQELLSSGEGKTLAEISAACGYPNKSYFCQVFKKFTGMTPGEYEQQRGMKPHE